MRLPYKKLLNALSKAILFWAALHFLISVIAAVKNRNIAFLNIFNIIQTYFLFTLPFPIDTLIGNIVSMFVFLFVYLLAYFLF